jgi:hypothetical protein
MRRQANIADLNGVVLQVAGDQPNTQRYNGEPAIVYADRNAINPGNCQLTLD